MFEWFKRRHKHDFTAVESFSWYDECMYRRIIVFKCIKCETHCYFSRWAFMRHSGALTHFFHRDIPEDFYQQLTYEEARAGFLPMLSKYFEVCGNKIQGLKFK